MNGKWVGLLVASGAALTQASIAMGEESTVLDEVIVTAQKREQRLIDVPMSVTAVSSEQLVQRGVQSIQDLSFAVPGVALRMDGPGSQEIFMRGIGNLAGGEALVSVYMDESPVTLYNFRQLDLRALDIERIEVLKGPQGTLYGQGAVAGTIRYVTRKPVLNVFEGRVESEVSFIDEGDSNEKVTGVINVPLVDDELAVRVAATGEWGGGWIDQPPAGIKDGNNQDLYNVRTRALWQPTDALEVNGTVAIHRLDSVLGLDWEKSDRTQLMALDRSERRRPRADEYDLYNLTASYDFGFANLISATTYIDQLRDYTLGYIGGPATAPGFGEGTQELDDRSNMFTQEVRLVSAGEGPLHYTIGAFYRDVESDLIARERYWLGGPLFTYDIRNASESLSFFLDVSYDITPRLEIGAGVRSFHDDSSYYTDYPDFADPALLARVVSVQSDTFSSTDPRVYANFKLSDNWNLYANIAKGFRSGGFNAAGQPTYKPEKVISYEIGTKGTALDGVLQFDLAAYYSDYKDMLRRNQTLVPGLPGPQVLVTNIGTVEIRGFEAGLGWRPVQSLLLSASGAYIDSEVTQLSNLISVNRIGDEADYVPKLSYTVAADYEFDWHSGVSGFFHVDYNYRDKVKFTDRLLYVPGQEVQTSDDLSLLGARIGARWQQFSLALFGTNLTNTNRSLDPFDAFSQGNRTKPRTIGVSASFDFR